MRSMARGQRAAGAGWRATHEGRASQGSMDSTRVRPQIRFHATARTQETMYSRRKKVRTGTKKVETLLRKFNKSRDSDGAGPRKSGQKWEWANKSLNIANSATEYLHFVGDSTKQLVLGN